MSLAIAFTAIGALIAETTEPRFRGLAMGGYNSAIYFGMMIGLTMIGALAGDIILLPMLLALTRPVPAKRFEV